MPSIPGRCLPSLFIYLWNSRRLSIATQLMIPYNLHVLQNCFLASPLPSWLCAVGITALVEELYLALLNRILFFPSPLLRGSSPFQVGLQH